MPHDHDDHFSRRHALECMIWTGTALLWTVSGGIPKSLNLLGRAEAATATAQTKPTIPIIVKDTTSFFWQIVLAGARKAGQDLDVNVPELGAQSESDINGQISILENAVSSNRRRSSSPLHSLQRSASRSMKLPRKSRSLASIQRPIQRPSLPSSQPTTYRPAESQPIVSPSRIAAKYGEAEGDVALITSIRRRRFAGPARQGLQGAACCQISGLENRCRQGCRRHGDDRPNIMTDIITANPDLRGVFASNLIMAQGRPGRRRKQDR